MDIKVKKRNGRLENFEVDKINASAQRACEEIEDVSASEIVLDAQLQLFDKITTKEIDQALILSAREKIEKEPNYSFAAARLLLNCLYKEVFKEGVDSDAFRLQYRKSFIQNIKKLVKQNRLDKRLLDFDLNKLSEAIKIRRDKDFKYLGIQILFDRYFLRFEDKIMETPQAFWMRVAMGLSINEENKEEKAIEFYNLFSQFLYTPSTPTFLTKKNYILEDKCFAVKRDISKRRNFARRFAERRFYNKVHAYRLHKKIIYICGLLLIASILGLFCR